MKQKETKKILGKLPPDLLLQGVLRYSGTGRPDVIVGAGLGEDAAVVQWPDHPYLVAASDPVVGANVGAGRLLVHINANDVACKGADPAWLIVTLIVPSDDGVATIERIMGEVHETCLEMGIAVVGGHTELTDRYDRPVIVGTMLGSSHCLLSADHIQEGDLVLVTGHAGLEGMSILAHDRPDLLSCLDAEELKVVRSWQEDLSVVRAARLLRDHVRYMHDPTEGGLEGGLLEIRRACGLGIVLNMDAIPVSPLTRRAAAAIGFDPLHLISSGMLIAVLSPERAAEAQMRLAQEGITSNIIGHFVKPRGHCRTDMHEELWEILARERV